MKSRFSAYGTMLLLISGVATCICGCHLTDVHQSELAKGPTPLREPSPARHDGDTYEDSLTGGKIFSMYCGACHNFRTLSERPFSNYQNVAAHMRVRANLTGKEYAKLLEFMRRVHDVPSPNPPPPPSPKRFIFSQPINELREAPPAQLPQPKLQGEAAPEMPPPAVPVAEPVPANAPTIPLGPPK